MLLMEVPLTLIHNVCSRCFCLNISLAKRCVYLLQWTAAGDNGVAGDHAQKHVEERELRLREGRSEHSHKMEEVTVMGTQPKIGPATQTNVQVRLPFKQS